jgi:hypothetical protein
LCKIPHPKYGYKQPKLEELYKFLFKNSFEGAHNSKFDTQGCAACFIELVRMNKISLEIKQ